MTKQKEKVNCLFEVFAGELVSMLIKVNVERTKQSAKGVELIKAPLSVTGYLTDEDATIGIDLRRRLDGPRHAKL